MVEAVVAGLMGAGIGFLFALPAIGPVSLSVVRSSLAQGQRAGFFVALGAALVDTMLCLVALLATGFLSTLMSFLNVHPLLSVLIQFGCVGILIGYGVLQLRRHDSLTPRRSATTTSLPFVEPLLRRGHFFVGIGMALTNLANPTFPSSLAYLAVAVHEFGVVPAGQWYSLTAFAIGFGAGNFSWLALVSHGIHRFRRYFSGEAMERLRRVVGVAFIGVGAVLGMRILTAIRWHDVLRFLPAF